MRAPRGLVETLKVAIRERGLRATTARVSVLAALRATEVPLSHADLVERLVTLERDRTTIFRNLAALVRAHLVRRIDVGDHVWRYVPEPTGEHELRADFVCTACGSLENLRELEIAARGAPRAISRREIEVHIRGICNACR
jgi:Fur family transcriptional regulator, ferric uptake regulator